MHGLLLRRAIIAVVGTLLCSSPTIAQRMYNPYQPPTRPPPPAKKAAHVEILKGPVLEFARDDLAIIRWTTNNPGGTDDHFSVIHYGTDPKKLSQVAKSHIRINRTHSQTIFRVRVDDLKPRTTYYYWVTSMGSDDVGDGEKSPIEQFTTPGPGKRIVNFPQPK